MDKDYILSIKEAYQYLKITRQTLHKLTTSGKIKTIKLSDKRVGIMKSEIDKYLTKLNLGDDFNQCDKYWATESYENVMKETSIWYTSTPTSFSPDNKKLYVRTLDIAVCVFDYKEVLDAFCLVYDEICSRSLRSNKDNWSYRRYFLLEVDYLMLWDILAKAENLPEGYLYPEFYLKKAIDDMFEVGAR